MAFGEAGEGGGKEDALFLCAIIFLDRRLRTVLAWHSSCHPPLGQMGLNHVFPSILGNGMRRLLILEDWGAAATVHLPS